eukprot:COSAG01_NODE_75737_length_193_cov_36.021277_1_plen_55_part_10
MYKLQKWQRICGAGHGNFTGKDRAHEVDLGRGAVCEVDKHGGVRELAAVGPRPGQ